MSESSGRSYSWWPDRAVRRAFRRVVEPVNSAAAPRPLDSASRAALGRPFSPPRRTRLLDADEACESPARGEGGHAKAEVADLVTSIAPDATRTAQTPEHENQGPAPACPGYASQRRAPGTGNYSSAHPEELFIPTSIAARLRACHLQLRGRVPRGRACAPAHRGARSWRSGRPGVSSRYRGMLARDRPCCHSDHASSRAMCCTGCRCRPQRGERCRSARQPLPGTRPATRPG
jgi:hypothetical protein